jgi:hypothetical protein
LAVSQRRVLFLELPADDDELLETLFETPQLEIETVVALVVAHGAKYSALKT